MSTFYNIVEKEMQEITPIQFAKQNNISFYIKINLINSLYHDIKIITQRYEVIIINTSNESEIFYSKIEIRKTEGLDEESSKALVHYLINAMTNSSIL